MKNLAYPIGTFSIPAAYDPVLITDAIATLAALPDQLNAFQFSASELATAYRPGGWTARQVIHHFADSHINAFIRCKMATTEDWPEVRPYAEAVWAEQADHQLPIATSINIIQGIHQRWVALCQSLSTEDWQTRGYIHPQYGRKVPLWEVIPMYQWHCQHHLAHLKLIKEQLA